MQVRGAVRLDRVLDDAGTAGGDVASAQPPERSIITSMRNARDSNEAEMVAVFLSGEVSSERFGSVVRDALLACGQSERLLAEPDLNDADENQARRAVLAATRGYGEDRELFAHFPAQVRWEWIELTAPELARVRYLEYSYWNELSGGSRMPADAAQRIRAGVRPWGISNERFHTAARALRRGHRFPPLILAGPHRDDLVCLEGNLRLTAHALAGFPIEIECLVGTAPALRRWAQ